MRVFSHAHYQCRFPLTSNCTAVLSLQINAPSAWYKNSLIFQCKLSINLILYTHIFIHLCYFAPFLWCTNITLRMLLRWKFDYLSKYSFFFYMKLNVLFAGREAWSTMRLPSGCFLYSLIDLYYHASVSVNNVICFILGNLKIRS